MINGQWLELPMSQTNFNGPKDNRAKEVQLYIYIQNSLVQNTGSRHRFKTLVQDTFSFDTTHILMS